MVRKIIISLCLFVAVTLQWITNASAVPDLQLYTPGGTYDTVSDTWVYTFTPGNPFTLQVISANHNHPQPGDTGVFVSVALTGFGEFDTLPAGNIINFAGTDYTASAFTWGKPDDFPDHGIFDAHYLQVNVGSFSNVPGSVCNTEPGFEGDCTWYGEAKNFSVTMYGSTAVHFDAYTLDHDGDWEEKAPLSHDAEGTPVPEPTTIALLSMGIVSLLGYKGRKFLKKS
ncbi:MAG TPA: choice-of-anchor N protein [Candidatus Brocadiia bacterium]|nr:choice-of-anchor N protein [Candidatus Brocadiales bacterium]